MHIRKEGNVLFNNTFYLRLYGVGHMVKDHSNSEKGNPLPPHGLLFPFNSKGSFICTIPQRPVVEHWLEREIAQFLHIKFKLFIVLSCVIQNNGEECLNNKYISIILF